MQVASTTTTINQQQQTVATTMTTAAVLKPKERQFQVGFRRTQNEKFILF